MAEKKSRRCKKKEQKQLCHFIVQMAFAQMQLFVPIKRRIRRVVVRIGLDAQMSERLRRRT